MSTKTSKHQTAKTQLSLHQPLPIGSKVRARIKSSFIPRTTHGGSPSRGKRKQARPFSPRAPLHLVLRADRAKGLWSMQHRRNKAKITAMVYTYAARFKVRVYQYANVGNHLHLMVKAKERKNLADFLRVLAGRVAVTVTGARKHVKRIGKFWDDLYWSRLINYGRDFFNTRSYVLANELEEFSKKHREAFRTANQRMANTEGIDFWEGGWWDP